jgi:hypothetical protein
MARENFRRLADEYVKEIEEKKQEASEDELTQAELVRESFLNMRETRAHYTYLSSLFPNTKVTLSTGQWPALYPHSRIALCSEECTEKIAAVNKMISDQKEPKQKKKKGKAKKKAPKKAVKKEIPFGVLKDLFTGLDELTRLQVLDDILDGCVQMSKVKKHISHIKGCTGAMKLCTELYNMSRHGDGEKEKLFQEISDVYNLGNAMVGKLGTLFTTDKQHQIKALDSKGYKNKTEKQKLQWLYDFAKLQPEYLRFYYTQCIKGSQKSEKTAGFLTWEHPDCGPCSYAFLRGDPHKDNQLSLKPFQIEKQNFTAVSFSVEYGKQKYSSNNPDHCDKHPTSQAEIESIMAHAIRSTTSDHMSFLIFAHWRHVHLAYAAVEKICGPNSCENFIWAKANPQLHLGPCVPNDHEVAAVGSWSSKKNEDKPQAC